MSGSGGPAAPVGIVGDAETVKLCEPERRSQANGVPGVQRLSFAQLRELEPDVAGVAAMLSPTTAIVDYSDIARSFAADVVAASGLYSKRAVAGGHGLDGNRRAHRRRTSASAK